MSKKYACTGCGRQVDQLRIKNHIENCQKYSDHAFYLKKTKNFSEKDDINQLKFISQQLALSRDYIESLIKKKNGGSKIVEQFDMFGLSQSRKVQGGNIKVIKSEFHQQPIKKDLIKNSFSFNQFAANKLQSDSQIQMQKLGSFEQIIMKKDPPRQQNKMRMDSQPRMGFKKQANMMKMEEQEYDDLLEISNPQIVQCPLCKNKFYSSYNIDKLQYIQECWELVCKKCLRSYVEAQFVASNGFPKCPHKKCQNKIPYDQSRAILGDRFQILQDKVIRKINNFNIVQCIKCQSQYDFTPGNPNDAPKIDKNGKPIPPQYAILFAQQRFNCPRPDCRTQQCKECKATPYHLGMSCKQFQSRAAMQKCRYCDNPITEKNINKNAIAPLSDICNSEDCQQLAKQACTKILPCNHPCSGIKNEAKCLPCLREGCCQNEASLPLQKGSEFCAICFIECISAAPAIQCGCGHIFHQKCVRKRFQIRWLTPRILFKFCLCPLCNKQIEVPPQNQLYKPIQEMKELHALIKKMSLERLKFQELEKDQKLVNKDSQYYNKPSQYAMAIYAYFMCFKCQKPYFGGRKNCAEVMNNEQNIQGYNAKQLVCPRCCDVPIENCPKHGVDFIEFKCKFCCSTAQWFCWGNTHFCEPCHKRQCNNDYVSKYTKEQLPKCQGPGKCPIGGNHGGNGDQKMLGCAICRNYKQNSKNF